MSDHIWTRVFQISPLRPLLWVLIISAQPSFGQEIIWSELKGSGPAETDGWVLSIVAEPNGNVVVGGDFQQTIEGTPARMVARWDGSEWNPLGMTLDGFDVQAVARRIGEAGVYVGGSFETPTNNIAHYAGGLWRELGQGVSGEVRAIATHLGEVYVGGDFDSTIRKDGSEITFAKYIVRWSGTEWEDLDGIDGAVNAIISHNGVLYIAGEFTASGSDELNYIARWNDINEEWEALVDASGGIGVDNYVYAMAAFGNTLYVAGAFDNAGSIAAADLAAWNRPVWSAPLGATGADCCIRALAATNNYLYIGGDFLDIGSLDVDGIARWDGAKLEAVGEGVGPGGDVLAFAVDPDLSRVYVGGRFNTVGGTIAADNIAYFTEINTGVGTEHPESPLTVDLGQNYPNPIRTKTSVPFTVQTRAQVAITVYDLLGETIATIADGIYTPGRYTVSFDAADLASGVYFYGITTKQFSDTKPMIIVR